MSDLQLSIYSDDQEARVFARCQANLVWVCRFPGSIYGGEPQLGAGRKTDSERGVDLPKATQHVRSGLRSRTQVLCESLPLSCPAPPRRPRHTLRQFSPGPAEPSMCRLDLDERVSLCRACRLAIVLKPCVGFSTPPVFYFFLHPQMVSLPAPLQHPAQRATLSRCSTNACRGNETSDHLQGPEWVSGSPPPPSTSSSTQPGRPSAGEPLGSQAAKGMDGKD